MLPQGRDVPRCRLRLVLHGACFQCWYRREVHGLLDIFVEDEPYLYHIRADEFNYEYLADRFSRNKLENFAQLVSDIVSYATGAALNRGAVAIRDDGIEATFSYPSRHGFEEETIWLLYKFAQSRECRWPWMCS